MLPKISGVEVAPCLLPKIFGVEVTPSVTSVESSEQFWCKIRQIWHICEPWAFCAGTPSPLACLLLACPFFLVPSTSKRLLHRPMVNYACVFSQSELGKYFEWVIMVFNSLQSEFSFMWCVIQVEWKTLLLLVLKNILEICWQGEVLEIWDHC